MSVFGFLGDVWNTITGQPTSRERREQARAVQEQLEMYREQTRLANEELEKAKHTRELEQQKINEKQVRALRSNYSGGFLSQGPGRRLPAGQLQEVKAQALPNKLGA